MTQRSCTNTGSTLTGLSCTDAGATSAPEVRATLHLYMCNIGGADLAPTPVQHALHLRRFNNEYPHLLTLSVMHCVQDSRYPLPDFTTTPVAQASHVSNQQNACAEEAVRRLDDRAVKCNHQEAS